MNNMGNIKQNFLILSVLIQLKFSNQVGIHPEYDFCYPGTGCVEKMHDRTYKEHVWEGVCLDGDFQSPIDLPALEDNSEAGISAIRFSKISHRVSAFYIVNDGHTIKLVPTDNYTRGWYEHKHRSHDSKQDVDTLHPNRNYNLFQAHFHWGPNNSVGSEHTIRGFSYAMEMHVVYYSARYENLLAAMKSENDPSAFAVFAIFFDASDNYPDNHILKPILKGLSIHYHPEEDHIIDINLQSFLPKRGATFYRYYGSLTTPNCNEFVRWHVFVKPIKISTDDMERFRKVRDRHGDIMIHNNRPTQKGNQRPIYFLRLP